jgi:hypothetical protein
VGDLYLKEALRQYYNAAEKKVTSNSIEWYHITYAPFHNGVAASNLQRVQMTQ